MTSEVFPQEKITVTFDRVPDGSTPRDLVLPSMSHASLRECIRLYLTARLETDGLDVNLARDSGSFSVNGHPHGTFTVLHRPRFSASH